MEHITLLKSGLFLPIVGAPFVLQKSYLCMRQMRSLWLFICLDVKRWVCRRFLLDLVFLCFICGFCVSLQVQVGCSFPIADIWTSFHFCNIYIMQHKVFHKIWICTDTQPCSFTQGAADWQISAHALRFMHTSQRVLFKSFLAVGCNSPASCCFLLSRSAAHLDG